MLQGGLDFYDNINLNGKFDLTKVTMCIVQVYTYSSIKSTCCLFIDDGR